MNISRFTGIKAFSLVEIMVALIIIGVLSTIAIPGYQNFIENGRAQLCATNQESLKSAFDIYMVEHNVVPGDLSQLSPEAIEHAFAKALRTKGWGVKLALFLENWESRGYAFAQIIDNLAKGNLKLVRCPSERGGPGAVSYGFNSELAGLSKPAYLALPDYTVIIADSSTALFSGAPEKRHKYYRGFSKISYANALAKGGWVKKAGVGDMGSDCVRLEYQYSNNKNKNAREKQKIKDCWKNCLK